MQEEDELADVAAREEQARRRRRQGKQGGAGCYQARSANHALMAPTEQGGGVEGFADGGACIIPGVPKDCPPARAAVSWNESTLLDDSRIQYDRLGVSN